MGGWSDKVGRRPTLIVPVLGGVLDTAGVLIVMIFELPIFTFCLLVPFYMDFADIIQP